MIHKHKSIFFISSVEDQNLLCYGVGKVHVPPKNGAKSNISIQHAIQLVKGDAIKTYVFFLNNAGGRNCLYFHTVYESQPPIELL